MGRDFRENGGSKGFSSVILTWLEELKISTMLGLDKMMYHLAQAAHLWLCQWNDPPNFVIWEVCRQLWDEK
jgi:hypothetical protein